jgi:hypothetical protein
MAEIQEHIAKRDKRNSIFQRFYAKEDEEAIAAWKLELRKIRNVFDVRPFAPIRRVLTFGLQTKLAINADVDDTQRRVSNIHITVPNLVEASTVAPAIHRNVSENHEDKYGQNSPVST